MQLGQGCVLYSQKAEFSSVQRTNGLGEPGADTSLEPGQVRELSTTSGTLGFPAFHGVYNISLAMGWKRTPKQQISVTQGSVTQ